MDLEDNTIDAKTGMRQSMEQLVEMDSNLPVDRESMFKIGRNSALQINESIEIGGKILRKDQDNTQLDYSEKRDMPGHVSMNLFRSEGLSKDIISGTGLPGFGNNPS